MSQQSSGTPHDAQPAQSAHAPTQQQAAPKESGGKKGLIIGLVVVFVVIPLLSCLVCGGGLLLFGDAAFEDGNLEFSAGQEHESQRHFDLDDHLD